LRCRMWHLRSCRRRGYRWSWLFRWWRSRWWCCRWLRWLGRLLWPSLAARAFWGTTIRSARDEIEFGLDPEDMVESCCE